MNGVSYFMDKQGRSVPALSKMTGIPEPVIHELCKEQAATRPSSYYMRLAEAFGITVTELLRYYTDREETCWLEESGGMSWEERFPRIPDTCCQIYLAKITGEDPAYRYSRDFQPVQFSYSRDAIHCRMEHLQDGVYEVYARWYDPEEFLVNRSRAWFAVVNGVSHALEEADITYALENLEAWQSDDKGDGV